MTTGSAWCGEGAALGGVGRPLLFQLSQSGQAMTARRNLADAEIAGLDSGDTCLVSDATSWSCRLRMRVNLIRARI
jgi:hypothetical protein